MKSISVSFSRQLAALVLPLGLALPCLAASEGFIIGVSTGFTPGTAPVVKIDPVSGAYTVLNSAGNSYHALAQDSHGNLYAGSFSVTAENGRVSRIDPYTGVPLQTFNAVTPGAGDIRGLAFDPTNRLFAAVNRNDAHGSPTLPDDLYEIDLTHETTSLIGSLGFLGVQGLDFSPSGSLYAWDVDFGLLTVDPSTGTATDVNPSIGGTAAIQSLVFAPDGRLFGARQQLFSINPLTGAFSPIGPGGGPDIRGIEWLVPEPSTFCLFIMTIIAAIGARRSGRC
jgi:hypothetical protein